MIMGASMGNLSYIILGVTYWAGAESPENHRGDTIPIVLDICFLSLLSLIFSIGKIALWKDSRSVSQVESWKAGLNPPIEEREVGHLAVADRVDSGSPPARNGMT
jgi:hypothetical protein